MALSRGWSPVSQDWAPWASQQGLSEVAVSPREWTRDPQKTHPLPSPGRVLQAPYLFPPRLPPAAPALLASLPVATRCSSSGARAVPVVPEAVLLPIAPQGSLGHGDQGQTPFLERAIQVPREVDRT